MYGRTSAKIGGLHTCTKTNPSPSEASLQCQHGKIARVFSIHAGKCIPVQQQSSIDGYIMHVDTRVGRVPRFCPSCPTHLYLAVAGAVCLLGSESTTHATTQTDPCRRTPHHGLYTHTHTHTHAKRVSHPIQHKQVCMSSCCRGFYSYFRGLCALPTVPPPTSAKSRVDKIKLAPASLTSRSR